MSEIKRQKFHLEQDEEGNLSLDIQGKGGELAAMLAAAMDDDPDIYKLFEFAFMMLEYKKYEDEKSEDETLIDILTENPPTAEA